MVSKRKYLRKKKTLRTGPCSPFSKTITAWTEKRTLATRESRDYSGTPCRERLDRKGRPIAQLLRTRRKTQCSKYRAQAKKIG